MTTIDQRLVEALLEKTIRETLRYRRTRSKGHRLTLDSQALVCAPCNKAKGSLSLQRFANRLAHAGDPQARPSIRGMVRSTPDRDASPHP
jgi:hypothetical protein